MKNGIGLLRVLVTADVDIILCNQRIHKWWKTSGMESHPMEHELSAIYDITHD